MVTFEGDMKPLKDYLDDKKEMMEIMFSSIEEHQLKKMLPDVLKDAKIEDIKAECLVELLGMSKKRILGIMEGRELDESSEDSLELSDISDEATDMETDEESADRYRRRKTVKESNSKSSSKSHKPSAASSGSEDDPSPPVPSKTKKGKKKVEESVVEEPALKKVKNLGGKKSRGESSKESKEESAVDPELELTSEKKGGKNLLEILELEMRARAIRSLLEREEKKNKGLPQETLLSISETVKPVIDLEVDDNDPDAVIVVEEPVAEQIDLTKDESDTDDKQTKSKKVKETTLQVRVYRNYSGRSIELADGPSVSSKIPVDVKDLENKSSECLKTTVEEQSPSLESKKDKTPAEGFVPRNWTERWLESNDVQKVMKTTKVLTNLKKRLLNNNKQKTLEERSVEEINKKETFIEGTVSEYSQLPSKVTADQTKLTTCMPNEQINVDNGGTAVEASISNQEAKTIAQESETVGTNQVKVLDISSQDLAEPTNECPKQLEINEQTADGKEIIQTVENLTESNV